MAIMTMETPGALRTIFDRYYSKEIGKFRVASDHNKF
jgi:hypothetical protein